MSIDNSQHELNEAVGKAIEAISDRLNEVDKMLKATNLIMMSILVKNPELEAEVIKRLELYKEIQSDQVLSEIATEALKNFK